MTATLYLNYHDERYYYDLATDDAYLAGKRINLNSSTGIYVRSDGWAPATPEQDDKQNRMVRRERVRVRITGTSQDDVGTKLSKLEQVLEAAGLYDETAGVDGMLVWIEAKWTNETNARYCRVYYGKVIKPTSWQDAWAETGKIVLDATIEMTCEEYWLGWPPLPNPTYQYARNEIANAGFLRDANADGLADSWTKLSTPTCTMDTTYFRLAQSQKVICTAADQGVYSDAVTAGTVPFQAKIWLRVGPNAAGTIRLGLYDSSSTAWIASAYTDVAPPGANGLDWTQYEWWDIYPTAGHSVRLRAQTTSAGTTTFYLDTVYLQQSLDNPRQDFWADYYIVYNNPDPDQVVTNYIAISDVQGDAPALIELEIKNATGGTISTAWIGARNLYPEDCGSTDCLVPLDMLDDFSGTADANCIGGSYMPVAASGTTTWTAIGSNLSRAGTTVVEHHNGAWRYLLRCFPYTGSSDDLQLRFVDMGASGTASNPNDAVASTVENKWTVLDLGAVWPPLARTKYRAAAAQAFYYNVQYKSATGGTVQANYDAGLWMPTHHYFHAWDFTWNDTNTLYLSTIPQREGVYIADAGGTLVNTQFNYIGGDFYANPNAPMYVIFCFLDDSGTHDITQALEVTTRIVPRYRSVRGDG